MRRLIVGGAAISVQQTPFVVRLYTPQLQIGFCGGSLLSSRTVLTAAHCVVGLSKDDLFVGTYQTDIFATSDAEPLADVVPVESVHIHPDYVDDVAQGNDVAVLKLQRAPTGFFVEEGGPRPVPFGDETFWSPTHRLLHFVLGYGAEVYQGPQSYYLEVARVSTYSRDECNARLNVTLDASNRCAGLEGFDSCSGDSGGPLVAAYDGHIVQIGIVSWGLAGFECGSAEAPGVYALPDIDFIRRHDDNETKILRVQVEEEDEDPCTCTTPSTNCTSNGFSVIERCGCADHVQDGTSFCYVTRVGCEAAVHSTYVLGAMYRGCEKMPLSPPLPPAMPQLLSQPSSPPPRYSRQKCGELRALYEEDYDCCTNSERDECFAVRDEYRQGHCCPAS